MSQPEKPFDPIQPPPDDSDRLIAEIEDLLSKNPPPEEVAAPKEEATPKSRSSKKKKRRKIIYYTLISIFSAVFLFSTVFLAQYLIEQHRDEARNDELGDIVASIQGSQTDPSDTLPDTTLPPSTEPTEPSILPEYQPLYEMNDDMVGWIKIEGTNVNYPVMQSIGSPDYYLNKNFDKQTSKAGAIYVREACDVFKPSDNVVIYGHYISSGQQMFTHLHKYRNKSFWQSNQYVTFDTLYEHHTYQIFAVFKTSANPGQGYSYHRFNDALDKEDFDEFVSKVKSLSFYDTGITPQYGDKLITLSTCEYTLDNGRLVVVAVQVS